MKLAVAEADPGLKCRAACLSSRKQQPDRACSAVSQCFCEVGDEWPKGSGVSLRACLTGRARCGC
jgi:hypothetical protein